MKKKLPPILNFEDLWDQYKMADLFDPQNYFLYKEKDGKEIDKSGSSYRNSTKGIGEEKQKKVLELLSKYKTELDEIEGAMLDFVQYQVVQNPQVYVARTRDVKTDIEYFTAKTFFPLEGGRRKEVKVYVGKAKDYNNDTKSMKAQDWARIKMKQTLNRRFEELRSLKS